MLKQSLSLFAHGNKTPAETTVSRFEVCVWNIYKPKHYLSAIQYKNQHHTKDYYGKARKQHETRSKIDDDWEFDFMSK